MNKRNFLTVVLMLLASAAVALLSFKPARFYESPGIRMPDFPKTIMGWASEDLPLSGLDSGLLETKNFILRNYSNKKGDSCILLIIYSADNRKAAHPPEIDLQGSGETVTGKSTRQLTKTIKATELIIDKRSSQELAVYWYKSGKQTTDIYLKQQLGAILDRILGRTTSAAFIRVSTNIGEGGQREALSKVVAFCAMIEPLLDKYVP